MPTDLGSEASVARAVREKWATPISLALFQWMLGVAKHPTVSFATDLRAAVCLNMLSKNVCLHTRPVPGVIKFHKASLNTNPVIIYMYLITTNLLKDKNFGTKVGHTYILDAFLGLLGFQFDMNNLDSTGYWTHQQDEGAVNQDVLVATLQGH